jgi:hypothetical protein
MINVDKYDNMAKDERETKVYKDYEVGEKVKVVKARDANGKKKLTARATIEEVYEEFALCSFKDKPYKECFRYEDIEVIL